MSDQTTHTPMVSYTSLVDPKAYAALGASGACPGCGTAVTMTDQPSCPRCKILLTMTTGVQPIAIAVFILAVIALAAPFGASLLAMYALHAMVAEGEMITAFYPILMAAQMLQIACIIHGLLVAIRLLEGVRFGALTTVAFELTGAFGTAAFIIWKVREELGYIF